MASRWQAAFDGAEDALLIIGADGSVLGANRAAGVAIGRSPSDLCGRPLAAAFARAGAGAIAALITGRASPQAIAQVALRDGDAARVTLAWVDGSGAGDGGTLRVRPVTDERDAYRALVDAREAAERANRTKSAFLANISHELRTPLNGMIGMTELALGTRLDDEPRRYLQTARSSAHALLALIDDLLDFSRIEAGRMRIEAVEFELRALVFDRLRPLARDASAKGLELVIRIDPKVPDRLIGDPGRLGQVLVNLVGNAIKFTERGEVEVGCTIVRRPDGDIDLQCFVRDTGIGIPASKHGSIFDAFEQADASATRKFGGTGLGLAICRKLCELMDGGISVDSGDGRGSTFRFTLRVGATSRREPDRPAATDTSLRVLLLDDNPTSLAQLSEALRTLGHLPLAAGDPLQAARLLADGVDLLLVDGRLGSGDGFAAAADLRQAADAELPVVMMLQSHEQASQQRRCRALDVAASLTKPFSDGMLAEALAGALAGRARSDRDDTAGDGAAVGRRLSVLVVDDDMVGTEGAGLLLAALGHEVTLVADARDAIELCARRRFDLALFDLPSSLADGLGAPRAIRAREASDRLARLPLVVMTAHAGESEREACTAAGIDDLLVKPVTRGAIANMLSRHAAPTDGQDCASTTRGESATAALPAPLSCVAAPGNDGADDPGRRIANAIAAYDGGRPYDRSQVPEQFDDDPDLLQRVSALFAQSAQELLGTLATAVAANDFRQVEFAAHSLKGTLLMLGADREADVALALEIAAARGLGEPLDALVSRLREGAGGVVRALAG